MSEHTPGPWHANRKRAHQDFIEVIHNNDAKGAASLVLARVTCRRGWWDEQHANASLIAAAPELLAALCRAIDAGIGSDGDYPSAADEARAAIAKATGSAT